MARQTTYIFHALAGAFLLMNAQAAHATDYLVSIGDVVAVGGYTTQVSAGDGLLLDTLVDRSYSCEGIPSNPGSLFAFNTELQSTIVPGTSVSARANGDMAPLITGNQGNPSLTRVSFIPHLKERYRLEVDSAMSGGEEVRIKCNETTLFGGYNTFVNDYNYLELVNKSNKPISGWVLAHDFRSDELMRLPFTVPAGTRVDVDVHSRTGKLSYGIVKVVHDGPYQALMGFVAMYSLHPRDRSMTMRGRFRLQPAIQ